MKPSYPLFKCLLFLTFNLGFFVIGIVIWRRGTGNYGNVISYETSEWGTGPVMDVIAVTDLPCPDGYDHELMSFWGTETYCRK